MAINSIGLDSALYGDYTQTTGVEDKTSLDNDDFMTLLLTELQYQDPTEPTDTEAILTQTSQLASLESSDKTNQALEDLTKSLGASQQFSTISAIGKTADLGSDAISYEKGSNSTFEVYFPNNVQTGDVNILDLNGNVVQTISMGTNPSGVYQFTWDGELSSGEQADSGIYHVTASYEDDNGEAQETRLGAYPIESVKFDGGQALLKLGSSYIPLENIKEVY